MNLQQWNEVRCDEDTEGHADTIGAGDGIIPRQEGSGGFDGPDLVDIFELGLPFRDGDFDQLFTMRKRQRAQ